MDWKKYLRRAICIFPSIPVAGLGVLLMAYCEWGTDPLTTFEIGMGNVFGVQLGTASLVFEGIVFFVFLFLRRDLVNIGTLEWCFLIGPSMNVIQGILDPIIAGIQMTIAVKIAFIIIGSILIIVSLSYYIPIGLGYQTSDIFAFVTADIIHKSYGIGLMVSYAVLFIIGVICGASWGIGTIVAVALYGPIIDRLMPIFKPFSYKVAGMTEADITNG